MRHQLLLQSPAGLDEQAAIDGLVGHLIAPVFRIRSLQPACDLLDRSAVARLPEAPDMVFMAGQPE